MRVSPPQFVGVVVDGQGIRPGKPRTDHRHSYAAVHSSAADARREAPLAPEQIPATKDQKYFQIHFVTSDWLWRSLCAVLKVVIKANWFDNDCMLTAIGTRDCL